MLGGGLLNLKAALWAFYEKLTNRKFLAEHRSRVGKTGKSIVEIRIYAVDRSDRSQY